ncbi:restriction endonuclease subunit S [Thiocapsa bogorovii]|nr:restriction endonuclease subunit S [Thiocapsa bogorovii]
MLFHGMNLMLLRFDRLKVDPRFCFRVLQSNKGRAHARREAKSAINQASLGQAQILSLTLDLPPLPEQRRIAEILDTLDEAIRKTEQVIAKLQQMKQGLLHDLLTRGIDDNGELRDPERNPEQFKDSPLGRMPRGWALRHLGEIAVFITSGSRGWATFYSDTGPLFLRIGNLTRDHINLRLESVAHVRPPSGSEGQRTSVEEGDLLISITADLGIIGIVPSDLDEAYVNQHVALIRLDQACAHPRWIGHFLAGRAGQQQFERLNDQGAKSGLNLPAVGRLRVALPATSEQVSIAGILDDHDVRIRQERVNVEKLRTLKQGLMDDLLTGRVRVPVPEDAEA